MSTETSSLVGLSAAEAVEPVSSSIRSTTSWTVRGIDRAVSCWPWAVKLTSRSGSPSLPEISTRPSGACPTAPAAKLTMVPLSLRSHVTSVSVPSPCAVVAWQ